MRHGSLKVIGVALLSLSPAVMATPISFSGSSGTRAAEVLFTESSGHLVVTLTNSSAYDVGAPGDVLTAVFFNASVPLTLTSVSATVPAGSSVLFGSTDPGEVVGGEWAYQSGVVGAPGDRSYGISSAGFNLFGPGDRFPGNNLQGPTSPDGVQYGITSAGDDPTAGNSAVTGDNALIKNQVVFVLSGLPQSFDPAALIGDVFFQYGTALDEGGFTAPPVVPEPTMVWMVMLGSLFAFRKRSN